MAALGEAVESRLPEKGAQLSTGHTEPLYSAIERQRLHCQSVSQLVSQSFCPSVVPAQLNLHVPSVIGCGVCEWIVRRTFVVAEGGTPQRWMSEWM